MIIRTSVLIRTAFVAVAVFGAISLSTAAWAQAIQHDTEHYVMTSAFKLVPDLI